VSSLDGEAWFCRKTSGIVVISPHLTFLYELTSKGTSSETTLESDTSSLAEKSWRRELSDLGSAGRCYSLCGSPVPPSHTFEAILAPVALTCFGQLPHELYIAPEHLPTAAHFSTATGCTTARLPLGQQANMCAERRVPPRVDWLRPPREQIGSL